MELIKCPNCRSSNVNLKPSLGLNWFTCLQRNCGSVWEQDIRKEAKCHTKDPKDLKGPTPR